MFADDKVEMLFILPQTKRGLTNDEKLLVLLSDGSAHFIPDLDHQLARYSLEQLGVPTSVVKVKHIHNGQKYLCRLDEVGHWYSVSNGSRVRECNFNQVLMRAVQNGGWVTTFDEDTSPVTFDKFGGFLTSSVHLQYSIRTLVIVVQNCVSGKYQQLISIISKENIGKII